MKKIIFATILLSLTLLPVSVFSQNFREVPGDNIQADTIEVSAVRTAVTVWRRFPWKNENGFFTKIHALIRQPGGDYPQTIRVGAVFYYPHIPGGEWGNGVLIAQHGWREEERIVPWNGQSFQEVTWELSDDLANEIRARYVAEPGLFPAKDSLALVLVFYAGKMEVAVNSDGEPIIWLTDAIPPEPPTLREIAPPDTAWVEGQGLSITLHLEVEVPNDTLGVVWEATNHGQTVAQQIVQPAASPKIGQEQEAGIAHNLEVVLSPLPLPIELEVKAKSSWAVRPTATLYSIWSDSVRVEYSRRAGEPALPEDFALHQNYPNPFNPGTTIAYDLPEDAHVELTIYNLLGQKIRTLVDEAQQARSHTVIWTGLDESGRSVASGIYLYKLQAGSFVETKKMLLIISSKLKKR